MATRKQPITPEDLHRIAFVSDPQISPDGSTIAFVRKHIGEKNQYITNIWLVAVEDGSLRQLTTGGKDSHPRWSPDGTRLAFISGRDKPRTQIWMIRVDGGEAHAITRLPEGSISSFKWSPTGDGFALAFRATEEDWTEDAEKKRKEKGLSEPPRVIDDWWYRLDGDGYFGAQRYELHLADAATGKAHVVYRKATLGVGAYDFSPDGRTLAVVTNEDRRALVKPWKDEIILIDVASARKRSLPGLPRGPKDAVLWAPDGRRLGFAGRIGTDGLYSVENLELWECGADGRSARSLTATSDHCLQSAAISDLAELSFAPTYRWLPSGREVLLRLGWHGEVHLAKLTRSTGKIEFLTHGLADHWLGNLSADGRRVAMARVTPDRPGEIAVGEFSRGGFAVRVLTDLNGALMAERDVAKLNAHWITSADGAKVHAWSILPPDHRRGSKKKYPAVLEVHGGPHTQYGVGFFHEFQCLAAQGYAVFFSNPRGSKGYGRDHCAPIRGHWGEKDWLDVTALADFATAHANVKPKHIGIMGGSYGGYMTNWAIGHTDRFRAAITDRCVSNVVSMGGTSDYIDEPDQYFPGNWWDRIDIRWEQSPIHYIGHCRTPTLIIHSEGDLRCNIEQAEQLFSALKVLGVPTRFVRYPRSTSHGMSRGGPADLRIHRLHQILSWWKEHLR